MVNITCTRIVSLRGDLSAEDVGEVTRPDTYPRARPPRDPDDRLARSPTHAPSLDREPRASPAPRCSARLSRAARPLVESIESASRSPRRAERKTRCRSPRSRPARPSRRSRVVPRPTRRARPHSDASHRSALARASSSPRVCPPFQSDAEQDVDDMTALRRHVRLPLAAPLPR